MSLRGVLSLRVGGMGNYSRSAERRWRGGLATSVQHVSLAAVAAPGAAISLCTEGVVWHGMGCAEALPPCKIQSDP